MTTNEFTYITYIRTTPEKLWAALTSADSSRQYWIDGIDSDWKPGSMWRRRGGPDNTRVTICGEVLESAPPNRLAMTWTAPNDQSEQRDSATHSRVSFVIEALNDDMVRLTLVHSKLVPGSMIERKITVGWPRVLSSLKSLLETGAALDTWVGY